MGNMDVTQREQVERVELGHASDERMLGTRRSRGPIVFNAIAGLLAIALCVAAVAVIESWAQWLVLGMIVVTTIGLMIAVSPNRPR